MQRIVLDTNVLVSALIGSSFPKFILYRLVLDKQIALCLSSEVFEEYETVLSRERFAKFSGFTEESKIVLNKLSEMSLLFYPIEKETIIKDKTDNKFIELAVDANAEVIVTGNHNDFDIEVYKGIQIMSPKKYCETYWSNLF